MFPLVSPQHITISFQIKYYSLQIQNIGAIDYFIINTKCSFTNTRHCSCVSMANINIKYWCNSYIDHHSITNISNIVTILTQHNGSTWIPNIHAIPMPNISYSYKYQIPSPCINEHQYKVISCKLALSAPSLSSNWTTSAKPCQAKIWQLHLKLMDNICIDLSIHII